MVKFFSDRDAKAVAEHLTQLGDTIEILSIFPVGTKVVAWYKIKGSSLEKNQDHDLLKKEKKKTE